MDGNKTALLLSLIAQSALHDELLTYPKPGLVSHIDNGSHLDMNYITFRTSINTLGEYFKNVALVASDNNHQFHMLKSLAIEAEHKMLAATNQINTHRGSIFILGMVIAATTHCLANKLPYSYISSTIIKLYKNDLSEHQININSHGSKMRKYYKLEGILDSAMSGFPLLFSMVNKLQELKQSYTEIDATLMVFFHIMQGLDDINLLYRGGVDGLNFARAEALSILKITDPIIFRRQAYKLHQVFIVRNLSPGGCADILAATIFLDKVRQLWFHVP